jgi:glycosyltransferase involved in cell wall biosynthesis
MSHSGAGTSPLKILRIIARLNIGGPARHVIYLAERMNQGDFRTVLVKGAESETEGTIEGLARERGVEYVHLPELGREIRAMDDWTAFWKLYRLMRKERPDIIHTHTAKAGALGRMAALFYRWTTPGGRKTKVFHTFHGHVLQGYFGPLKTRIFRLMERWLARVSTRVITLTERLRDEIAAFGVAPAVRIAVVPLGLELAGFLTAGASMASGGGGRPAGSDGFRATLGVPPGVFLVGIVGRLVPIKDHETLLEAVRLLVDGGMDVEVAIVGDGERRAELEARAGTVLPGDRVHFAGWRFDLPGVYSDLDAVVLCSLNEGTPVSLIEAMAAGRPVAATAVGGVPDLVGIEKNQIESLAPGEVMTAERGLLVLKKDPEALAKALRWIIEDPKSAMERAKAGREYVPEKFSVERLVKDLSALYRGR